MDFILKKTIGDVQLTLASGRHTATPKDQIRKAAAFPASGIAEAHAVEAFIHPLTGLDTTDLDQLKATLPAAPLPAGYRHLRLFDASTGAERCNSFVVEEDGRLTLHNVLFGALNHPTYEINSWRRTEWLPDMIPGVLDLEISITTRPRAAPIRMRP